MRAGLAVLFALMLALAAACAEEEPDDVAADDPDDEAAPDDDPDDDEPDDEPDDDEPDDEPDDEADDEPDDEADEPEADPEEAFPESSHERGVATVSEFHEAFPEHEQLMDDLLEVVSDDAEEADVDLDEPVQILLFIPSLEVGDAWAHLEAGLTLRLDELGIDHEITDFLVEPDEHDTQASQVEQALASADDYDFALYAPTEWEAQKGHVARLSQELPTIAYNVANPFPDLWGTEESPISHIAFDHEVGALELCDWAIEELDDGDQIALLRFVRGFVDDMRSGTFADCVEENSGIEVVTDYETDGDQEKAFAGAGTVLSSYPDVDMMHAASTAITLGASAQLEERGVADDVIINGWGGTEEELNALREDDIDVTVFRQIDDWGVAGAEIIRMHLEGREDEVPGAVSPEMITMDQTFSDEDIDAELEYAFRYIDQVRGDD
ncbi:hypothetical protein ER308_14495 [Egibacter rhizosphaerae]|uniref:Periplasmic binding protein domain-containing protein n=1 Tax=Egibacter rhizosphaerae TaxID=1670831 RepID=A0A411YHF6_9ACTN|nr:substrate-binding domain-containing protein [Egibacter rhizosphaerae]QBI20647.1 hypothetical protein ER308_14495 [Egibacter rhizosphaerae]